MGVELVISAFGLPDGRTPDWSAAAEAIERIDPVTVIQTDLCDELADGELDEEWEPWEPVGYLRMLRVAQEWLTGCAAEVRAAVDQGQLTTLHLPERQLLIAGGPTAGDVPDDLLQPMTALAELGVAQSAGFEARPEFAWGLSDFELDVQPTEEAALEATRAFALAEDWAARLPSVPASRKEVIPGLRAALVAVAGVSDEDWGSAFLAFLSETLAAITRLDRSPTLRNTLDCARISEECVELLGRAVGWLDRESAQLHLDEELAEAQETDLAATLSARVLAPGLVTLATIYGSRVSELRAADRPPPIRAARHRPERCAKPADALVWCQLGPGFNWSRARAKAKAAGLVSDLERLKALDAGEYRRLTSCVRVGRHRVWLSAGDERDGELSLTPEMRRLLAAGVVDGGCPVIG